MCNERQHNWQRQSIVLAVPRREDVHNVSKQLQRCSYIRRALVLHEQVRERGGTGFQTQTKQQICVMPREVFVYE